MNPIVARFSNLRRLEAQLDRQKDPYQRLILLDQLTSHYAFTNYRKAQKNLGEQDLILKELENRDFRLSYHLNTAIIENQLYNYLLAEIHFKQAFEILDERGDVRQQAEAYIDYAGTCINLNKMDQATTYLDKAAKLLEVFPDTQLEARMICREGYLNLHYSNYAKAIELLLEAEKRINGLNNLSLKDYYFRTLIHSGLGRVYERNDEVLKSVKAYENVVKWCEDMGMRTRLSWHYLNVGNGYMAVQNNEKAAEFFQKAIKIKDDVSQDARAGAYANLGYCYFKTHKYDAALQLYNRARRLYMDKSRHDYTNFSIIESMKAQLFVVRNKKNRAEKHFAKSLEYAQKENDYKQLSKICKDIATFYADQSDFESAYKYLMLHDQMRERHVEEVNHRRVTELEIKYEAEKKKQEAELLRHQSTGLQLKALRSQMNPHFMYNALNAIQNFITSNEVTDAAKYLAKFAKLMRQSLDYSDMEIISLEKEVEFLENYLLINRKLRFEDNIRYKIKVDDEIEEDIMGIPTMIIQPFIENAIEHGLRARKNGFVKVEFKLFDENTILCVIEDNGIGRDKVRELQELDQYNLVHESKGTRITKERLEILNKSRKTGVFIKTIDLKDKATKLAKGTRVEIQVPIEIIQKP